MFSVMWSEHCSYKSTRPLLATLPTGGDDVVAGPGENAGVQRIGDGLAVAFKIESHNHPSAVEPYQGAATGVGGILRDIFAMGARPIAVLDALRFGDPADAADPPPRGRRRRRRRRLRQLRRRADRRRRARLRPVLPGQPAGQRDGHRARPRGPDHAGRGARARATSSSSSAARPAATGSAARRSSPAPRSATRIPRSGRPSRSATRSPRSSSSRPPSSSSSAASPRASRTSARPGSPAASRRWPTGPGPGSSSTSTRSRAASRAWRRSRS